MLIKISRMRFSSGNSVAAAGILVGGNLLGEDRIFFGTDNCYHHGVGKVLASNTTEAQKRKIFFDNYNNMLRKGGHNVA